MAAKPFDRAKPDEIYAGIDISLTRVGDYLVGTLSQDINTNPNWDGSSSDGSKSCLFIASQDIPAPIRLVRCDRIFTFTRTQAQSTAGLDATYKGRTSATSTPLLTGWPAACVQGTKGEGGPVATRLPGDSRLPWWTAMLPAYPGVILNMGDHVTDDLARNYTVSSAELTALGWRLTLALAST